MIILSVYLFINFFRLSDCSIGDRDYNFLRCSRELYNQQCVGNHQNGNITLRLLKNNLIRWSCAEACEYECMSSITADRINRYMHIYKYYGHWPFTRYFGIEEPASAFFSILNGIPHAIYSLQYVSKFRIFNYTFRYHSLRPTRREFFMSKWIFLYAVSAVMAWFMSTIYHCKKTEISTKYDLVFALGVLVAGLVLVVRHILGRTNIFNVVSLVCISGSLYVARAISIFDGVVSFDSHMSCCIGLFSITSILWAYWACVGHSQSLFFSTSSFAWPSMRNPRWLCLICNLWLLLAALLELFDFPPLWGIFDAHSLWHAATAPLGIVWYRFWTRVEEEELLQEKGAVKQLDGIDKES